MSQDLVVDWIVNEDTSERNRRIARLEWLLKNSPSNDSGNFLCGGWLSLRLIEESKYCFAYGQYLATTILGVAFIERLLAAHFYGAGNNYLERATLETLMQHAFDKELLTKEEITKIDRIRMLRNPIIHFRKPFSKDTIEHRAVAMKFDPDELVVDDAMEILKAAFCVMERITG